ncbi:hypothetical protein ACJIZ3_024081 [Penstemon smallii]|uniref:Uncharacterized protein n=1 Tax=Penstemon smallii TaxID=265156 RepID=A0ABD3TRX3_9LAMI
MLWLSPSKINPFSPLTKLSFLNPNLMKGLLSIFLVTIFSLCYFSIFPPFKLRINCPECNQTYNIHTYNDEEIEIEIKTKTNISHILFGIAGSSETWSQRRHYCELWWKPNVTRGYVWLGEEPRKEAKPWPKTSPPYKVSSDTARFKYTSSYGSRSAVRIARIVKESFELGFDDVRWFVMGDDDTVFFTENLLNVLRKYDYREMYYIGGQSESVEQDVIHSYTMGYGGGGFAISYPLAKELVRILDGCIDRYSELYGSDQKIGGCMMEIGVDIRGSPYGLLSAHPLAPLVSLHHLDYVQPLFPGMDRVASVKMLISAYKSDPSRTLQQSFCYDLTRNWSVSVSWGYTAQLYPYLVTGKDLNTPFQTFLTWRSWSQEPFAFNTRVMSLDPCERPIIYYFDGVKEVGNETTLTSYKRPKNRQMKQCDRRTYGAAYSMKGFNVSAPIFDPQIWKKAPRRQCCEIINGSDERDGMVQVRIRGCNQWESVTLP